MADYTQADHICYVTMNPRHALVRDHIRAGGRAVVLEEGINGQMITLYDNGAHLPLLWTHLIPATLDGKATHNVQNAMFASAITYSMDKSLDDIRQGLQTFDTTYFQAPGRMNIFDDHPFKVILDYGHNPTAVRVMVDLITNLDTDGRRLVVIAAPGDRRDEDIVEIATHCAGAFDHYICRRDDNTRGRGADEVPRMQQQALLDAGVAEQDIEQIPDEQLAVERALGIAAPGDLLLIFADNVARTWEQITGFSADGQGESSPRTAPSTPVIRSTPLEDVPESALGMGDQLVRDQRGVRLPREADD